MRQVRLSRSDINGEENRMGFLSEERASSVQNKSLNLKQTPADIWEYDDAGKTSSPILSLKDGWSFANSKLQYPVYPELNYLPPIGIPTFWFTSVVPDWALDCTDGAGDDFATYPELDNEIFKQFLADFTTSFGATDDDINFTMPDLRGIHPIIGGTNELVEVQMKNPNGSAGGVLYGSGTYYSGGAVGELILDASRRLYGYTRGENYRSQGYGALYYSTAVSGGSDGSDDYYCRFDSDRVIPTDTMNRVVTFGSTIIVRFE